MIIERKSETGQVQQDRLWTIQDVSAFLSVPVPTLYGWRHRGDGPPAMRIGKHLRFEPGAVRRWAHEQVG